MRIFFYLILFSIFNSQINAQCAEGSNIAANSKCLDLSFDTPPAMVDNTITVTPTGGSPTVYNLSSTTTGPPTVYRYIAQGQNDKGCNNLPGFSGSIAYNDDVCTYVNGTLPVTYKYLEAKVKNEKVEIHWATSSEVNNDYFKVERASKKVFQEIGKLSGTGSSSMDQHYSFTDNNPLEGISFYRLQQYDFDGKATISPIIKVINNLSGDLLAISYNPLGKLLNLGSDTKTNLLVVNAAGQIVRRHPLGPGLHHISLDHLIPGIYFIIGRNQYTSKNIKIIIK